MTKLVALDLDGTLLNKHHHLSERTIRTLRNLSEKGVTIAFATGRSKLNIDRYIRQLSLPQPVMPVVCYNGAYGLKYDLSDGSYATATVFSNSLPRSATEKLIHFADEHGFVLQYYNGESGEVYAVPKTDVHVNLLGRYERLVDNKQLVLDSYDRALETCDSAKVLVMTEDADHLIHLAKEKLDCSEFTVIRGSPDPFFVEFLRADVTKGAGLALLCDHLGVRMEDVVAFGDGDNDKEMLLSAGLGCAMKNAKSAAKEAANVILEWTNDEDGVAKYLDLLNEQGYFD
eukprot:gene9392-10372_t